jgi:hypothetical protein
MDTLAIGCSKGVSPAAFAGCDFSHPLAMVVINNPAELAYMQSWFEINGRDCGWSGPRETYPIALSINDGTWTDRMDRAIYYVPFKEFVARS